MEGRKEDCGTKVEGRPTGEMAEMGWQWKEYPEEGTWDHEEKVRPNHHQKTRNAASQQKGMWEENVSDRRRGNSPKMLTYIAPMRMREKWGLVWGKDSR